MAAKPAQVSRGRELVDELVAMVGGRWATTIDQPFIISGVTGALQAPRRYRPAAVVVLVTLLVTPQAASTNLLYLQASSNRLALTIQSPNHNRQGRDAGHRTQHTHAAKQQADFPEACSLQNVGGYKIKSPCSNI